MNGDFFTMNDVGLVFVWDEVSRIHHTRNGICHRDGVLVSLLTDFGKINPPYQDRYGESDDVISYTGSGRRGDQKLDPANRAILSAIETRHSVPLFCKLGVNRWKLIGFWQVTEAAYVFDEPQQRMLWKFRLQKTQETP